MARPLKISFVSDVAGFLRGTKDIEGALDDVGDSLDDVSREAQRSGREAGDNLAEGMQDGMEELEARVDRIARGIADKFEDGLRQGRPMEEVTREAERDIERLRDAVDAEMTRMAGDTESATERMEASFKDAFNDVPQNAKANFQKTTASIDQSVNRAKASMGEVKQEALQNASETFSSFDGSARSLVDGVQGTFGGIVSSLGPVGAALGAVGAIGIGAITSALDKGKEKAEEFRDSVKEATAALREGGGRFEADEIVERLEALAEAAEDGTVALEEMNTAADEAGVPLDKYAQALAEMDVTGLKEVSEQLRLQEEEQQRLAAAALASDDADAGVHLAKQQRAAEERERIDETIAAREEAEARNELLNEAGIESAEARAAAEEAAQERRRTAADRTHERFVEQAESLKETNQGIADSIIGTYDTLNTELAEAAEDGELTLQELEDSLRNAERKRQESAERWAWATQNLTQNQINALLDMGEEGEEALDVIMNSPPSATAATRQYLEDQGRAKGQAERRGVADGIGGPITLPIEPYVDQRAYENVRGQLARSVPVRIIPGLRQAV